MKKTDGRKSHDAVPLSEIAKVFSSSSKKARLLTTQLLAELGHTFFKISSLSFL
jgi:hypothetical protein